jgi:hypothetical protein
VRHVDGVLAKRGERDDLECSLVRRCQDHEGGCPSLCAGSQFTAIGAAEIFVAALDPGSRPTMAEFAGGLEAWLSVPVDLVRKGNASATARTVIQDGTSPARSVPAHHLSDWRGQARVSKLFAATAVAGSLLQLLLSPMAEARGMYLSGRQARQDIAEVVAADHATHTTVNGCRRLSAVSVYCKVLEEMVIEPTATEMGVIEVAEGSYTATLKHDHGETYVRVHQVR